MPVAVVTRAVMAKPRFIPRFVWANLICVIQARRTTGFLNGTLALSPRGTVFYTLTVWQDGPAMMGFRESGSHVKFVPQMANWGSEAASASWKVADGRLPAWDHAHEALRTHGRFIAVEAPNNNHRNGVIPRRSRVILALPLLRKRVIRSSTTRSSDATPIRRGHRAFPVRSLRQGSGGLGHGD